MSFTCQVCSETARGYHFGAFTCEGCKSFFGRTYKNSETRFSAKNIDYADSKIKCKGDGNCDVQGRNRTSCKFCRFSKCIEVGMAPQHSRYGRRSKYFKLSSALEEERRIQRTGLTQATPYEFRSGISLWLIPIPHVEEAAAFSFTNSYVDGARFFGAIDFQREPLDLSSKR